jgi:signal transduction histidine kinase
MSATAPAREDDLLAAWLAARAEAERLEARWAALAETLPATVLLLAPDGLRAGTAALARLLGEPVPAPTEAALRRLVPMGSERAALRAALARAWRGEAASCRLTLRRGDGRRQDCRVELRPLPRETEPTLLAVVSEEAAPGALADAPAPADPLRALGLHLAGLAGELQGPLAAYRDHLDALARRPDLPAELRESLGLYREVTGELIERLGRALSWGRRAVPVAPVDLAALLEAAARAVGATLPASVELRCALEPAPPVLGAADQLHLAFEHLLRNAAEALAGRGGHIVVGLRPAADRVVVTVADDGPGIPPSLLPHVFEPFSSSKSITAGLGLGLPIVRDVVARHRGRLRLDSGPSGTTVTLDFERPAPPAAARRVLIVEDHDEVRATLEALLAAAGWEVAGAAGAEDALALLARQPADAILIDVQMAGRDGLALLEALALWHPGLLRRAALHTAYAGEERVRAAAARYGVVVLAKPCRRATLLETLERLAS